MTIAYIRTYSNKQQTESQKYSYRRRCHSTQQETNGDNAFDFVVY